MGHMPVARLSTVLSGLSCSLSLSNHLRITEKGPLQTGKQLLSGDEKRTEIGIRRMAERADRVKKEVTTWLTWLVLTWKPTLLYLPAWAFFCAGPKARTHSQTIAYDILRNYTLQSYCRNTEKDVSGIYETTECSWYRGTCIKVACSCIVNVIDFRGLWNFRRSKSFNSRLFFSTRP